MQLAIEASGLSKTYKKNNVKANINLHLQVQQGEIFGLLGPNGAGKTTFVKQVVGLLKPSSGNLKVMGENVIKDPDAVRSSLNYMSQNIFAVWHLKIREVIEYSGRLRGLSAGEAKKQTQNLLEELGIAEHSEKAIFHLSGGLRQLAGFGAAFIGKPRLLVLDEPTSSLDVARRRKLWDKVRELNQKAGVTVLLVTHSVIEAEHLLDRLAIIQDGRLKAIGSPGELKQRVDNRLRLEIIPHNGGLPPGLTRDLGQVGEVFETNNRVVVLASRGTLQKAVGLVEQYGLDCIDDFRIGTASLEDVYLKLGGGLHGAA